MISEIIIEIGLLLTIVVGLATILEYSSPFLKNGFIGLLKEFKEKKHFDIIKSGNKFINTFEHFYIVNNINFKRYQNFWAWFIITYISIVFFGIIGLLSGEIIELKSAIIIGLFFGIILYILYILFIKDLKKNSILDLLNLLLIVLTNVDNQKTFPENYKELDVHPIKISIILSYIVALFFAGVIILLGLIAKLGYPWLVSQADYPTVFIYEINIYLYILFLLISSLYIFIPTFYTALFFLLVYYFIRKNENYFKISPFRTILFSIIGLISFSLIIFIFKSDIIYSFLNDFNQVGWILFIYIFLNIFADSFSILETHYVIKLASNGKPERFPILLVFDFFASGIIFLTIPLVTGNFNIFYDAIFFKGEIPWLGILFWSTFLTSIFFYLYIFSIGGLLFFYKYSKINEKYLNIKNYPFYSLAFIIFIVYIIYKILVILVNISYLLLIIIFILIFISLRWYNHRNN